MGKYFLSMNRVSSLSELQTRLISIFIKLLNINYIGTVYVNKSMIYKWSNRNFTPSNISNSHTGYVTRIKY